MFKSRINLTKLVFAVLLALCFMTGGIAFLCSEVATPPTDMNENIDESEAAASLVLGCSMTVNFTVYGSPLSGSSKTLGCEITGTYGTADTSFTFAADTTDLTKTFGVSGKYVGDLLTAEGETTKVYACSFSFNDVSTFASGVGNGGYAERSSAVLLTSLSSMSMSYSGSIPATVTRDVTIYHETKFTVNFNGGSAPGGWVGNNTTAASQMPTTLYFKTYDNTGTTAFPEATKLYANNPALTNQMNALLGECVPLTPSRSGYTFNGYWTATSGGTQIVDKDGNWKITRDSAECYPRTIYAQWQLADIKTCQVTYNPNGGSISSSYATDYVVYGGTYAGKANIYRPEFSNLSLTNSDCMFSFSSDNTSGSGTVYYNFFTKKEAVACVEGAPYTIMIYVSSFSGDSFVITTTSPNDQTNGDVATSGSGVTVTGTGQYSATFTAKSDISAAVYGLRSYVYINAGKKSSATFYIGLFPGHFIGNPTNTTWETDTSATGTSLPTPTRQGYTFDGWWTAASGGTEVTATTAVTSTAAHTLYAHWTVNSYTSKVDPNGGYRVSDNSTSVISFTKDYGASEPISERKRTGYTLTGYKITNTSSGSTTDIGGATITFDASTKTGTFVQGSVPVTLTAQWSINSYQLKINPAGGTYASSSNITTVSQNYNTSYSISTPSRTGYTFNGWSIGQNLIDATTTFNGTSTVVALGRTYMYTDAICISIRASMTDWSTYGENAMRLISCTEGGGWNIESNNGAIQFSCYDSGVGYKVANSGKAWSSLSSGYHTFQATFDGTYARLYIDGVLAATSSAYTSGKIGYHASNGIFVGAEAGSSATSPAGSYFNGTIDYVTITNSATLPKPTTYTIPAYNSAATAQWVATTYTVTLNNQSATSAGTTAVYYKYATNTYYSNSGCTTTLSSITVPTRTGYTFGGYYTSTGGSGTQYITAAGAFTNNLYNVASSQTLYAKWTANTYTVTLNNQSATSAGTTTVYYKYGTGTYYSNSGCTTTLSSITKPTRTGYTFGGYYTSTGGSGTQYITAVGAFTNNLYNVASSQTLYAKWTATNYTLTANANTGSIPSTTGWTGTGTTATKTVAYGSTYGTLPVATKTGYSLKGWFTASSGGTQVTASTTMGAANRTIYAQWTVNAYTLTADCNGGSAPESLPTGWTANGTTPYKSVAYNSSYGTLPEPTKLGYIFAGWFTAASGGTEVYSGTQMTSTSGATIYAHWVESWVNYMPSSYYTENISSVLEKRTNSLDLTDEYYVVDTAEKLAYFAYLENFTEVDTTNLRVRLTADIDLSAHYWDPIADRDSEAMWVYFDGQTYDINNMRTYYGTTSIYSNYSIAQRIGLFGGAECMEIRNVTLNNVEIPDGINVGGIVGSGVDVTITNCRVSGECGGEFVGGIAGLLTGGEDSCYVSNCENYAKLNAEDYIAGGIVGYGMMRVYVSNCVNYGEINATGDCYAGGIIGTCDVDIFVSNCVNAGNVGINGSAGGIAGCVDGNISITNCINQGQIKGTYGIGGIIGDVLVDGDTTITNCVSTGKIIYIYNAIIGGIIGAAYDENGGEIIMSQCYVECEIQIASGEQPIDVGSFIGQTEVTSTITYCGANITLTNEVENLGVFYNVCNNAPVICNDSYAFIDNGGSQINRITTEHSSMDGHFAMVSQIHNGLPIPLGIYHVSQYGTTTGIANYLKNTKGCTTA